MEKVSKMGNPSKKIKIEDKNIDENNNVTQMSLLDLNDDCLNEILGYLSVAELYRATKVCKRLDEVITNITIRNRCADLPTIRKYFSVPKFLEKFGENVHNLVASEHDIQFHPPNRTEAEQLLHLIQKYCKSLRHLNIYFHGPIGAEIIENFAKCLVNLKTVKLKYVHGSDPSYFLKYSEQIEIVELVSIRSNSFRYGNFPNLHTLKLIECAIPIREFENILKNVGTNLIEFELKWIRFHPSLQFDDSVMGIIDKYCGNLIILKLSFNNK